MDGMDGMDAMDIIPLCRPSGAPTSNAAGTAALPGCRLDLGQPGRPSQK